MTSPETTIPKTDRAPKDSEIDMYGLTLPQSQALWAKPSGEDYALPGQDLTPSAWDWPLREGLGADYRVP